MVVKAASVALAICGSISFCVTMIVAQGCLEFCSSFGWPRSLLVYLLAFSVLACIPHLGRWFSQLSEC